MPPALSNFALRLTGPTGTRLLMDDLGEALSSGRPLANLGGGNPASIPAMQALFRSALARDLASGTFDEVAGRYDGPQGHLGLRRAVASLLEREYGFAVGPGNVLLTAGSQASFFMLFNMFSGAFPDGSRRRIDLPLTPEYIGYADIAIDADAVRSVRPGIEMLGLREFKYRVDFDRFAPATDTGAVCVSRPTNPTGNVLTDDEMARLVELTRTAGVPLIVDSAYGLPFPGIVFAPATPVNAPHVIHCLSLSKLGLPGLRTGIVVAAEDTIERLVSLNAALTLASSSMGASLVTPLFEDGRLMALTRDVIRPYYAGRVRAAGAWCERYFTGIDYRIHRAEGAIFLWLWFPGMPITAAELYARLKQRDVLVIPGHFFFPGLSGEWRHAHECIRISYAQSAQEVERGIRIIGEEVRRAFAGG